MYCVKVCKFIQDLTEQCVRTGMADTLAVVKRRKLVTSLSPFYILFLFSHSQEGEMDIAIMAVTDRTVLLSMATAEVWTSKVRNQQ